ncbi:hypothetical protein FACS1894111_12930 [Clostridia bacterium]|nr:hypothetical protein FACS1894111_12930 [Clostridia bacterium]
MAEYKKKVRNILSQNACLFQRHGKGDHDIWYSPITNQSHRHLDALNYAVKKIMESPVSTHVKNLYVFGSFATGTQQYTSDVDLFLVLEETACDLKKELRNLRIDVTMEKGDAVEADLTIVFGDEWKRNNLVFYQEVRKTGRCLL